MEIDITPLVEVLLLFLWFMTLIMWVFITEREANNDDT